MFRLEHPWYLLAFGLLLIVAVVNRIWKLKKSKLMQSFTNSQTINYLIPDFVSTRIKWRFILWLTAISFLIIAWCNPQWGIRKEKIDIESTDVFIALDISNSMLADDIKPNRLERSKLWAESFIQKMSGDRVGIILFAGHAFLQSPLTTDYGSAVMFIRSAFPELISAQGTNIGDAIQKCMDHFPPENEAQKVILLLSDGEDHDDKALELAKAAATKKIAIFTIGTGTTQGSTIKIQKNGAVEYKRDQNGEPVNTKLNDKILTEIADATKAKYYSIENGESIITEIKDEISTMEKLKIAERSFSEFESYYPYFLIPGIILLILEFLLSHRIINFKFESK